MSELPANEAEVKSAIENAIGRLFEHQPNIFAFTPETGQTEWKLAHHLAVELREFFPSMDHDLEITKHDYDDRRPDIVFHKRGTHEANHLVVELKKDGNNAKISADIEKIHAYWFRDPLHYQFGVVINLRTDGRHEVRAFKNTTQS